MDPSSSKWLCMLLLETANCCMCLSWSRSRQLKVCSSGIAASALASEFGWSYCCHHYWASWGQECTCCTPCWSGDGACGDGPRVKDGRRRHVKGKTGRYVKGGQAGGRIQGTGDKLFDPLHTTCPSTTSPSPVFPLFPPLPSPLSPPHYLSPPLPSPITETPIVCPTTASSLPPALALLYLLQCRRWGGCV